MMMIFFVGFTAAVIIGMVSGRNPVGRNSKEPAKVPTAELGKPSLHYNTNSNNMVLRLTNMTLIM